MARGSDGETLIQVEGLKMHFPGPRLGLLPWQGRATVKAVDDVDFAVHSGQALGLVGESGCGKSTLGRATLQLHRPTAGAVRFRGEDLCQMNDRELRQIRRDLQIIFQDPYASLDPRRSIGYTIGEPLLLSGMTNESERREQVANLLQLVGLDPSYENRYPHEFSGGQRQRVGIARALATDPVFVVADEPVSALDVSIQAQVINLLRDLQERLNLTYLFISHDLRVVRYISENVAVMYLGKIVEIAPTQELFDHPQHPYTQALLSAIPKARWDQDGIQPIQLDGEVPSPIHTPPGCYFASRCPHVMDHCREMSPELLPATGNHRVACYLVNDP
ncbi:MAG: oligopeptide/dipeptide ABC transporter ATP-binding protein [Chloroflexota bacterium]